MIQFMKRLFNRVRHGVFCAVRRRSRSERALAEQRSSRGSLERPIMSEVRSIDALRVETGSRNANEHFPWYIRMGFAALICELIVLLVVIYGAFHHWWGY